MAEKSCNYLPDDCWEHIFNSLDNPDLELPTLACKRFLSLINSLRTHLTIVDSTLTTHGTLSKLFHRFPNLTSIEACKFRGDLNRLLREIADSGLKLETLNISGSYHPGFGLEGLKLIGSGLRVLNCARVCAFRDTDLGMIADYMPFLEELNISNPKYVLGFGQDVTDHGIQLLSLKLKNLRKIDVSGNGFLTDNSLVMLSSNCVFLKEILVLNCPFISQHGILFAIRNSPNLSSLSVSGVQSWSSIISFPLIDSTKSARNLSTLAIDDSVLSDALLHLLAKAGLPLKRFTLDVCSDITLSGILPFFHTYQSLEYLALVGAGFLTDKDMSDICKCFGKLIGIKLESCSMLTESTLFMLAKNCPFLESIDMGRTNLGGGESILDMVKNPRIKSLHLPHNSNLSDECLRKIASICPSLDLLDVTSCSRITEEGIAEILKSNSKIRQLQIDECGKIKTIGTGFELPKLEVLRAAKSGIDDKGLAIIGNRCCSLLYLDLEACFGVTAVGLKEMLKNCKRLREINLYSCINVSEVIVDWMVFSVPSLRKINVPFSYLITDSQRKLFFRHGCRVC